MLRGIEDVASCGWGGPLACCDWSGSQFHKASEFAVIQLSWPVSWEWEPEGQEQKRTAPSRAHDPLNCLNLKQ